MDTTRNNALERIVSVHRVLWIRNYQVESGLGVHEGAHNPRNPNRIDYGLVGDSRLARGCY
jgi:hypothetical protein